MLDARQPSLQLRRWGHRLSCIFSLGKAGVYTGGILVVLVVCLSDSGCGNSGGRNAGDSERPAKISSGFDVHYEPILSHSLHWQGFDGGAVVTAQCGSVGESEFLTGGRLEWWVEVVRGSDRQRIPSKELTITREPSEKPESLAGCRWVIAWFPWTGESPWKLRLVIGAFEAHHDSSEVTRHLGPAVQERLTTTADWRFGNGTTYSFSFRVPRPSPVTPSTYSEFLERAIASEDVSSECRTKLKEELARIRNGHLDVWDDRPSMKVHPDSRLSGTGPVCLMEKRFGDRWLLERFLTAEELNSLAGVEELVLRLMVRFIRDSEEADSSESREKTPAVKKNEGGLP